MTMARVGKPTEFTIRRTTIASGMTVSPEFASVQTVTVIPRVNPPSNTVVERVTDPTSEISLEEARRYDPSLDIGDTVRQGAIGVTVGLANAKVVQRSYPIWDAVPMSFGRIWDVLTLTRTGITRWVAGGPDPGLAGPIGIAQVTGEVARAGIAPLIELTAFISISLGILNLLPIPALDGGRLMFVVLEWVRRGKRISPQREGLVHLVGFVVLISLVIVMSYFDVMRILDGGSILR